MGKIFQTVDISTHLDEFENEVYVIANDADLGASDPSATVLVDNGGITYELADSKDYYICTGIKGPLSGEIVIKSQVTTPDGSVLYVREIAPNAFEYNLDITAVTLPTALRTLGESAFKGCTNLVSVGVGGLNAFTTIGDYAFYGCEKLKKITIPKSMRTIGNSAFMFCSNLEQVTMLSGTELIGEDAFGACNKLASFTIPSSVKSIASRAFYHTAFTTINVPDSVTFLGTNVFAGCTSARTATLGSGISYIPEYTFYGCTKLTTVTFQNDITQIGSAAFLDCESLGGIAIPGSVKSIGQRAFKGCTNLEAVEFAKGYGWFYTEEDIPSMVIVDENCTYIPTITPLLLKQSFANYTWFRLEKMQAPIISVDAATGKLSILDNTGLADSYDIFVNDQNVLTVTAKNDDGEDDGPKTIIAGTYDARGDIQVPEVGTTWNLKFSARPTGDLEEFVQIRVVNDPIQGVNIAFCRDYEGADVEYVYDALTGWKQLLLDGVTVEIAQAQIVSDGLYEWFTANFEKAN